MLKANGLEVVGWYYDEGVSGTVPIQERPEFSAMMERLLSNGCRLILIESVSRFARDIEVQLAGHRLLKSFGIDLVPVDKPTLFTDDDPQGMAKFFHTMVAAIAEMERAGIAYRLRVARDRKSRELGRRIEGRPPFPEEVVRLAKKLRRANRRGQRRTLRTIGEELAAQGHMAPTGRPYGPSSVHRMLERSINRLAHTQHRHSAAPQQSFKFLASPNCRSRPTAPCSFAQKGDLDVVCETALRPLP
jgi:DNA invertase Pin-like site-specific DNA recombinase